MNVRILTISDIHYETGYDKDPMIEKYFQSFKDKLEELHSETAIDYVIITGDLAFSGLHDQYTALRNRLQHAIPENIPIFSIVGNHDVQWTSLKGALAGKKLHELFETDIQAEINRTGDFIQVFSHFEANFRSLVNDEKLNNEYNLTVKFCPKQYCGYCWDPGKKTLLLFLNSAWKSFGPGVIEAYINNWQKNPNPADGSLVDYLKDLLLNEATSQIGKQTYAFKYFTFFNEINDLLIEHGNNCRVITCAHHPPAWLNWEEQFNTSEKEERNLDVVLDISDILITGHLHNPVQPCSVLNRSCYHISSPVFMDYHFVRKKEVNDPRTKFPNNGFTLIDVYDGGFDHTAYRFNAAKAAGRGLDFDYFWDMSFRHELDFLPKPAGETAAISNEMKTPISRRKPVQITPGSLNALVSMLNERRSNAFKAAKPKLRVTKNKFYELTFSDEPYLVCVNSIEHAHEVLLNKSLVNFSEVLNYSPLLKELYEALESAETKKLPVIAFYDFVRLSYTNADERDEDFKAYANRQFVIYQSFKHLFFTRFNEFYKYKELNIVYDCIIGKE